MKAKKSRHEESLKAMESHVQELQKDQDDLKGRLQKWQIVLSRICSGNEFNGNNKSPEQSWKEWFEAALGEPIMDCPAPFLESTLSFDDAVVHLSTNIALQRKEHEKMAERHQNLSTRLGKRQDTFQRKRRKATAKLEEMIERKENGTEEDFLEEAKILDHGFNFYVYMSGTPLSFCLRQPSVLFASAL